MIIPYTGYTRRYLTIHICPMSILCPPWMSIEWLLTPKVLHHGPKGIQRWRVLEFGTHGMDIPGIRGWFGAVETIGIILFRCLRRFRTPLCFLKTQRISRNFPWKIPRGSNDSWNRILAWDDGDRWGFDPFTPGSAAISEARSWEIGPKK